jgi:hypothetical protein
MRLAAALETVLELLDSPRQRVQEAPLALTNGYATAIIAIGFARLGDGERARTLSSAARAAITDHTSLDAIHTYLLSLFEGRLAQALAR